MKPILVLGNITCDIIVEVETLPKVEEDIIIKQQQMELGGCAFNVAHMLKLHEYPMTLISIVGSGMYGDFIRQQLKALGYKHRLFSNEAHGCCYCLVDKHGERTFMAQHGVEYSFKKEWLNPYKNNDYAFVYVCGLDIDEMCGEVMLEYLEQANISTFFAGGPSVAKITNSKMERIRKLQPILHLNEKEALQLSQCDNVEKALYCLYEQFNNIIIITLGSHGSVAYDGQQIYYVQSNPCEVVDTIGAGDAHAAISLLQLAQNKNLQDALQYANTVSGKIVQKKGATLTKEEFVNEFIKKCA